MNGKICTRLKNNEALTVPVRSHYLRHYPTDYGKKSDPATSASFLYVTASLLTARIQETYKHRGAYSAAEDENTGPENADCYARRVTRRPTARPVLFRCSPTISSFVIFSTDRFFFLQFVAGTTIAGSYARGNRGHQIPPPLRCCPW